MGFTCSAADGHHGSRHSSRASSQMGETPGSQACETKPIGRGVSSLRCQVSHSESCSPFRRASHFELPASSFATRLFPLAARAARSPSVPTRRRPRSHRVKRTQFPHGQQWGRGGEGVSVARGAKACETKPIRGGWTGTARACRVAHAAADGPKRAKQSQSLLGGAKSKYFVEKGL